MKFPPGNSENAKKMPADSTKAGCDGMKLKMSEARWGTARTRPVACRAKSFGVVFVGVWPESMSSVPY
jgi:hypothetical protein